MTLRYIAGGEDDSSLQWVRDYVKQTPNAEPSRILKAKHTDKGIFLVCEHFKAYAWKGSNLAIALNDTLHIFRIQKQLGCAVYAKPLKDGSVAIAVDEETVGEYAWDWDNESPPTFTCTFAGIEVAEETGASSLLSPQMLARYRELQDKQYPPTEGQIERGAARKKVKEPPKTP